MNVARIRKAIAAALSAGATAALTAFMNAWPDITGDEWAIIIGGAVAAAIAAGITVYKVRNAGGTMPGGSDPIAPVTWTAPPQRP